MTFTLGNLMLTTPMPAWICNDTQPRESDFDQIYHGESVVYNTHDWDSDIDDTHLRESDIDDTHSGEYDVNNTHPYERI